MLESASAKERRRNPGEDSSREVGGERRRPGLGAESVRLAGTIGADQGRGDESEKEASFL